MIVDKVSAFLQGSLSGNDSDEEEVDGTFEDSEDEMVEDDGLDDMMTLIQYQSEARKEALIQKGSHVAEASHKKGRINTEGNGV